MTLPQYVGTYIYANVSTHVFRQVLPRPVPGPDPDGLLRQDLRGGAEVARGSLRGLQQGEAAETDLGSAHRQVMYLKLVVGRRLK